MNPSKLTVVIPAFKCSSTISRTISSVLGQTECRPDIIVVLDGEDASIRTTIEGFSGLTVKTIEENRGPQYCRNVGLQQASTEYVTFLDADDVIEGELHSGMISALAMHQADIAFSAWRSVDENLQPLSPRHSIDRYVIAPPSRDELITRWSNGEVSKTGAMCWKTSFLRAIGGWDETMQRYQDVHVGLLSLLAGGSACFSSPGTLLYVSHGSGARVSGADVGNRKRSMDRYFGLLDRYAQSSPNRDAIRHGIGLGYYKLAAKCFYQGSFSTGRECLNRSREFGYGRHHGTKLRRFFSYMVGLEKAVRLAQLVRSAKGQLG